ncbi:MAG TPA: hypothetical protein VK986_11620 [Tepidisphaeraceae bacterium]|nr:hypothetical protein [Tepidisphaeraceae bacterium]
MTQLNLNAHALIEDRLDAIGQRFRVLQLLRGVLLFLGGAAVSALVLGIAAHVVGLLSAGESKWLWALAILWAGWLAASFLVWVVRPLVLRPRALETARMVEARVEGLHNTLTNSLLLAAAKDLAANPYLPAILDENLRTASDRPLDEAVRFADLRRPAIVVGLLIALFAAALLTPQVRNRLSHGWRQIMSPGAFVPVAGETEILEVQPGDATLLVGQPLDVVVTARNLQAPAPPTGRLIFAPADGAATETAAVSVPADGAKQPGPADLVLASSEQGKLRYTYRVEHVDRPLRYRVEVGGTQSPWFTVRVVKAVKLKAVALTLTPPAYTKKPAQHLRLTPDDLEKSPITVPQGTHVEIAAEIDTPVGSAMLQLNDAAPAPMSASDGRTRFAASKRVLTDTAVSVLLTESGQIITTLPERPIQIRVTPDAPPVIEMQWPTQDTAVAPDAEVKIRALLRDDYGVTTGKVLVSTGPDQPLAPVQDLTVSGSAPIQPLSVVIPVKPELRKHGNAIRVQIQAADNRNLRAEIAALQSASSDDGGPQTTSSTVYEIKFRDPEQIRKEKEEHLDELRATLLEMLKTQQSLHAASVARKPADLAAMAPIATGQTALRTRLKHVADTFKFDADDRVVQKTLQVLYHNPARDAVDLAAQIPLEKAEKERAKLATQLQSSQRRIIATLESLLALLVKPDSLDKPQSKPGGDIPGQKEALEKLNEALRQFLKEEQRILDQTAQLAKKPVDDFTDKDKKLLDELTMAQEKLDAFIAEKVSDVSKLAEQDMSSASLLKEMMEVYAEVTMAKGALKDKAMEIAVAAEEMGQELAKEIQSNIEKWLMSAPDRQQWKQEDAPAGKTDIPMAELPKELEDLIGELMEEQEDLFEEIEDMDANWADSMDKGVGWDAADGPIANMSAKGVTGNQQPNDNNMNGRAGEGRSGKSQGEMVEETATGKGGRPTPTRLDPTPFQTGQVKDTSKDPVGGATGGGKTSGQGAAGLEGPVPPKLKEEMKRLADKQAQLRNNAERLNLQLALGRYDNFKLLQAIAMMRRTESDLRANRYQTALRRKDVTLDAIDTSRLLTAGQLHVKQDTSPAMSHKMEDQIKDAMKGDLPAAWSEALKAYYRKLATE